MKIRKQQKRLEIRRKRYDSRHNMERGFRRPGSMNPHKSHPVGKR